MKTKYARIGDTILFFGSKKKIKDVYRDGDNEFYKVQGVGGWIHENCVSKIYYQ